MSTDWSLDFCLVCDRQTSGGPYCSQSCRLAELDVVSSEDAMAQSPIPRESSTRTRISPSSDPIDSTSNPPSSLILSSSASQTSLSSLKSQASHSSSLSDRLQDELRDYASSFDPVRDLKRRMTS
ncbi:hypothetical protein NUU61_007607 [Penicillium alfredii]|uniref:Life-span regulatory factor n=1 Tax=Penicillium alfredii TaxID=1506179 RepID=A0A9W9ER20_9EURO|nr:uncharacterized protein NUU61_007607 [Penicillium alfredii]KAJ5086300.1 hypothetical protein NUU61_007607 [Penicillium alfredii]